VDLSNVQTGTFPLINVELVPAILGNVAYTQVIAYPWDGPQVPESFVTDGEVESCQVLKASAASCSPAACDALAVACIGNNQWARKPVKVANGNLGFAGLALQSGGTSFTLSPVANMYQAAGPTEVAFPPCTPGADVSVTGGAGTANVYSLTAKCIETVVVTSVEPVLFERAKPAQFNWTPGSVSSARIAVEIDISHHDSLKGLIRCDVPDTGSLTVDASLVTKLIDYGTAGFPDVSFTRHSTSTTAAGIGTATLDVKSSTTVQLQIPGVISCSDTLPCATGQCVGAKCQ
jgi:hypothetical protein